MPTTPDNDKRPLPDIEQRKDVHGLEYTPREEIKRPFTRATGYVFQTVGFLLTISTCCLWPAAYWWQGQIPVIDKATVANPLAAAAASQVWGMCSVAISFLGGMLLLVVGMGLQHDRMRTGRAAMGVTGVGAIFYVAYLVAAIWKFPATFTIVVVSLFALLWLVMFVLAFASADELRKNPPTPSERGWTSIDEDDLRTISSHRSRDKTNP